jgi:hypothetical protein
MSNPQAGPPTAAVTIPLAEILGTVRNPFRWYLLGKPASGEQIMVSEIAERIVLSPDATSKAIALFRDSRIVIQGCNRFYQLVLQIADKAERLFDFGYCLLRMNVGADKS